MCNSKIVLASEGLFPLCFDVNGNRIENSPATGFSVSGTIQGEGKMAGLPVLFLRTAGCNLRCMWNLPNGEISLCDTPLASFSTATAYEIEPKQLIALIKYNLGNLNHLVISGGEPFLQAEALSEMITMLKNECNIKIAIETNGTLFNENLVDNVDFFSISPKLKNSVSTISKAKKAGIEVPFDSTYIDKTRRNIAVIQQFIDHCNSTRKDFQLKFVIGSSYETDEIENSFLDHLQGWKPEDIVLMPVGGTPEELSQTRLPILETAISKGWRFSPRLHITYFNGISGV